MASTSQPTRSGKLRNREKWTPKTWRPEYDRIVAYSAMGKSNVWIADLMHYTKEHISTVLNQPEAKALMERLQGKLRENIEVNIPDVLGEIAKQAASRLKEVMFDDELFQKSPFQVLDRGLDVLKGLNHLRGGGNGSLQPAGGSTTNIGTVVITQAQRSDLLEGLERVKEVHQLHGGDGSPPKTRG